jgi:hypothetical protein
MSPNAEQRTSSTEADEQPPVAEQPPRPADAACPRDEKAPARRAGEERKRQGVLRETARKLEPSVTIGQAFLLGWTIASGLHVGGAVYVVHKLIERPELLAKWVKRAAKIARRL